MTADSGIYGIPVPDGRYQFPNPFVESTPRQGVAKANTRVGTWQTNSVFYKARMAADGWTLEDAVIHPLTEDQGERMTWRRMNPGRLVTIEIIGVLVGEEDEFTAIVVTAP